MQLYLSSYRTGDRSAELKSLAPNRQAVVIVNALDNMPDETRLMIVRRELEDLEALGFDAEELDLRQYFAPGQDICNALNGVGLVWVAGGNTFLLRKAFSASGFDRFLTANKTAELLYGGYSAGACIMAPTLRGLEIVDELEASAEGYTDEVIWDGLGLIPYSIAPHYKSDHPESALIDGTVEYFIENKIPFVALRDGEVEVARAG